VAGEVSFDVVSDFDRQELVNALDQARREIATRFDFKGAKAEIELGKDEIVIRTDKIGRASCRERV
jgi:cyclic-di-GMP-binding protein